MPITLILGADMLPCLIPLLSLNDHSETLSDHWFLVSEAFINLAFIGCPLW